jgi:hypothetical protein
MVAKMLVCGGLAATLAAAAPFSAMAGHADFNGPPVVSDAYNDILAASIPTMPLDLRFSGRLVRLDPYNATLAAAAVSLVQTVALEDLYKSYAFAPSFEGPRVWESSTPLQK